MTEWPTASLDPIRRAKVIGAAISSAAWAETVLDVPYDRAWAWLVDFERSVPSFDRRVDRIRVDGLARRDGAEQIRMSAWNFGVRVPFDVRLEDGFCLMRAKWRLYLVVMAAVPEDGGRRTRFLHMEAVPLRGMRWLRWILRREVAADVAGIHRELRA